MTKKEKKLDNKSGKVFQKTFLFSKALLVQLVERRSPKSGVEGSSPSGRVFIKSIIQIYKKNSKKRRLEKILKLEK